MVQPSWLMILWCENEGFASRVTTKIPLTIKQWANIMVKKVGFWGTLFSGKPLLCLYVITTVIYQCVTVGPRFFRQKQSENSATFQCFLIRRVRSSAGNGDISTTIFKHHPPANLRWISTCGGGKEKCEGCYMQVNHIYIYVYIFE